MTNEKIIATIDKYVESLDEGQRNWYSTAFDISRKENRPIKEAFKNVGIPVLELAIIVQELEEEMKKAAQKKVGGNSYVKRTTLINKLITSNAREEFRKGWFEEIKGERMQCFIVNNATMAFAFRNTVDAPMTDAENHLTLNKILNSRQSDLNVCEYDIADIRMQLKMSKARKEKGCTVKVGNKYYDAQLFINAVDGLGGDAELEQDKVMTALDILRSDNGFALICPVRPPKE